MLYAVTHFTNHAFALFSIETAEAARSVLGFWHRTPFWLLLLAALTVHVSAVLWGLARRRSLKMPPWQVAQILLGLAIPFWLLIHILATRGLSLRHDMAVDYWLEFWLLWPGLAAQQSALLLLVWLHGCIGIHFWLRQHRTYRRVQTALLVPAVLVPALSLAGFVAGSREMHARIASDPNLLTSLGEARNWVPLAETAWIYVWRDTIFAIFMGVLIGIVLWHGLLRGWLLRIGTFRVGYGGGRTVRVPIGTSVLEASRIGGVSHASVCGGRGRCSTCRIRITGGAQGLPAPSAAEGRVLERLGAGPEVRLACQLRPGHDIDVVRLMPADAGVRDALARMDPAQGVEREVAVLFADLRGFTRLAERRLPYDVVYVLNRYFAAMGEAIEGAGGRLDKFVGDGIMALFGIESEAPVAARRALAAARAMSLALERLNTQLQGDLREPLRMGIGLHMGPAIVGEMGYGETTGLTAIGDTVNVASRLEAATKELDVELVVADELLARAGVSLEEAATHDLAVRGRSVPLGVKALSRAASLPGMHHAGESGARGKLSVVRAGLAAARARLASARG